MKTKEMIKALEKKGYKIEEPERFLKTKLSLKRGVLLEDKWGNLLVGTMGEKEEFFNDFEYFKKAKDRKSVV